MKRTEDEEEMKQTKPSRVSKIENPRQKIEIVYSFFMKYSTFTVK